MVARKRGNGSIFRQSGCKTWTIQYFSQGKRIREKTGTEDYQQAQQMLRQRLYARDRGEVVTQNLKVRVGDLHEMLMRDYRINGRKSMGKVDRQWKNHLQGYFGNMLAGQVTTDVIERYVDSRLAAGAAVASVNRETAALKTMFRLAGKKRTIPRVPMFPSQIKENNTRTNFVEDAAFRRLAEHASELWLRVFLELAYTFGWRKSELLGLRVHHVDLLNRSIRLDPGTTKNGAGREVYMTEAVYRLLQQAVTGKRPDDFVLTRANNKPVKSFRKDWLRLCEKAELPGLLIHDFRRSAARNLRRAGVAESVIMATGGWKTRQMFDRYAIVSNADQRDATEKLERSRSFGQEFSHDFSHDSLPYRA